MKKIMIGTHPGLMHKDDVVSVALVMIEHPELRSDVKIVRTRNEELLEKCDLILDVGMKYDGVKYFDHHQEDVPVYENGIKYSACGLYLRHMKSISDKTKEYLLNHGLYAIQGTDNGQDIDKNEYTDPFSFVSVMNCDWKTGVYGKEQDERFLVAVDFCYSILMCLIHESILDEEANIQVKSVIANRGDAPWINIGSYCPWRENVIKFNNGAPWIRCVVYQNSTGQWQCQVVPKALNGFESWCDIPELVSKLPGFVFRHKAGFLAGFDNEASAINCARVTSHECLKPWKDVSNDKEPNFRI